MLSAYVEDYQRDWDTYLPYVMVAYRSAEHKTTGCTPNYLMFGREVSTLLDIMYEMPNTIKEIPKNQWVREMEELIEEADSVVRHTTERTMLRQKRHHDLKVSWQSFVPGDEVYVYFPVRKGGRSSKLSCILKGPFKVLERCTDVTYKVSCGYHGKSQVIHVD